VQYLSAPFSYESPVPSSCRTSESFPLLECILENRVNSRWIFGSSQRDSCQALSLCCSQNLSGLCSLITPKRLEQSGRPLIHKVGLSLGRSLIPQGNRSSGICIRQLRSQNCGPRQILLNIRVEIRLSRKRTCPLGFISVLLSFFQERQSSRLLVISSRTATTRQNEIRTIWSEVKKMRQMSV